MDPDFVCGTPASFERTRTSKTGAETALCLASIAPEVSGGVKVMYRVRRVASSLQPPASAHIGGENKYLITINLLSTY